ncbi:protein FAR1-RELATED SEQUENCE 5-like [Hordeum vulgare]|nr:protein FAR1-RELATED SEQUENCE 5-like [Hordeum vulgare]
MGNSIENMFPRTVHRCCRWHTIKKAQEKLGGFLGRHLELAKEFNEVIDLSITPEELETRWAAMVVTHGIARDKRFDDLYAIKHLWVPCYFRKCFFPFIQSTQQSEGFNAVLKRYVNPQNSVLNFVKQYEKINDKILVKERGNDYRTEELEPRLWSTFPLEKQALRVYTRDIYY